MDRSDLLSSELEDLCAEARRVRDDRAGGLVTYSPKVFIPLTKLCRDVCHYCTFAAAAAPRRARLPDRSTRCSRSRARAPRPAAARRSSRSATSRSCATAPPATSSRRSAARRRSSTSRVRPTRCSSETGLLPHLNPGVMTRRRPARAAARSALDGDHARDDVRPALASAAARTSARPTSFRPRVSRRSTAAGEERVPFTTGILIGIGETRAERIDALLAIRELARAPRPRAGGDRPELPREAGDADGRRARAERSTSCSGRSPSRGSCSARRRAPAGAAEPHSTTSRVSSTPASTTGAASRP